MDMNTPNPMPTNPVGGIDTSTHKIFGIPRRAIAFGFALFLMLVVLAVVYSQFASKKTGDSMNVNTKMMQGTEQMPLQSGSGNERPAVTGPVTPDVVADDLIDEAISDRDDLTGYDNDEMADVEDGSNY